tara:strand:+ start:161 stop:436 length:276 start_codon:yes stop_codon:yes gene_type:complete
MKTIYSLLLQDSEYEQLQKHKHTNFSSNSKDWFCYETELSGGEYYAIDNPSARLLLFLTLKGYEYDVETDSKGWQSIVKRTMQNSTGDICS